MANAELERFGFDSLIDRRSYEEQGIEKVPTVHMGVAAMQMERREIRTERGNMNRQIEISNKEIQQLRARIIKLDKWIAEESANTKEPDEQGRERSERFPRSGKFRTPPTLADIITNILYRQGQYGTSNLKAASQMLIFLQENKFSDLADLEQKVSSMYGKVNSLREDMKPLKRRIETLDNHLMHSENYKKYRKVRGQYDNLYAEYETLSKQTGLFAKSKAEKALKAANDYYEEHRPEIAMYDSADEYLRGVLQKRFDPKKLPITKWQNERVEKISERAALYREYETLKTETQKVEQIKRSVTDILRSESPERTQQKSRSMAL
jgi:hypothetical protein